MFKLTLLTALVANALSFGQRTLGAIFKQSITSGSLMRVTEAARCEPIVIVDGRLANYEPIHDIAHTSLNQYSALYMQAIALTSVTVKGVQIINRLGRLNPNRSGSAAFEGTVIGSMESHAAALLESGEGPVLRDMLPTIESFSEQRVGLTPIHAIVASNEQSMVGGINTVLKDSPELAVGKLLEVTLREGKEEYKVPVTIRLAPIISDPDLLVEAAITRFGGTGSYLTRKAGWKSGRLKLIQDGLFTVDLARKHRNMLIKDVDGVYAAMTPQKSQGMLATIITSQPSLAMASNMMFLSKESAQAIEAKLGGSFDNQKFREAMFERTGVMLLVVVDTAWDSVTFYYDSIAHKLQVPVSKLTASNKKDGPDVNEVLRALTAGNVPRNL